MSQSTNHTLNTKEHIIEELMNIIEIVQKDLRREIRTNIETLLNNAEKLLKHHTKQAVENALSLAIVALILSILKGYYNLIFKALLIILEAREELEKCRDNIIRNKGVLIVSQ